MLFLNRKPQGGFAVWRSHRRPAGQFPNRADFLHSEDDKRPSFVHIGSVIDGVLKNYRAKPDFELTEVWRLWDDAVGETIAKNARPAAFKGKLLIVHVMSSTWLHQLQFLKNDLMTKINAALGKPLIQEIKFKIGPLR